MGRHARQVHHPPAEEGLQLQADGRRGILNSIDLLNRPRNWFFKLVSRQKNEQAEPVCTIYSLEKNQFLSLVGCGSHSLSIFILRNKLFSPLLCLFFFSFTILYLYTSKIKIHLFHSF